MISSVHIFNWRSHSDTLLKFKRGTNLLVGLMGSGKSSVMDVISFALFGTFPALDSRKLNLKDIIRLNEDNARVVLELKWNGDEYRIEREIESPKRVGIPREAHGSAESKGEERP